MAYKPFHLKKSTKDGKYYFTFIDSTGKTIAESPRVYTNKATAIRAGMRIINLVDDWSDTKQSFYFYEDSRDLETYKPFRLRTDAKFGTHYFVFVDSNGMTLIEGLRLTNSAAAIRDGMKVINLIDEWSDEHPSNYFFKDDTV